MASEQMRAARQECLRKTWDYFLFQKKDPGINFNFYIKTCGADFVGDMQAVHDRAAQGSTYPDFFFRLTRGLRNVCVFYDLTPPPLYDGEEPGFPNKPYEPKNGRLFAWDDIPARDNTTVAPKRRKRT